MSVAGQPNKKVMSQGHAIEVSPKLAERDANTKDTGVPSEGSGDLPKKRRCVGQCFPSGLNTCPLTARMLSSESTCFVH